MPKGLRAARSRQADASAIMILRAETPQEQELFQLFNRLAPEQRRAVLTGLRELVAGQVTAGQISDRWAGSA